jgi:uncharacterized protein (TIGR02145 family)
MMKIRITVVFGLLSLLLVCCSESKIESSDIKSVQIGNQIWMAQNLNVAAFRNGEPIPEAKNQQEWVQAGEKSQPAWCHFNNDPASSEKYGRLYNFYAATDPRGIAPEGWHVASDDEWTQLSNAVGGDVAAGTKLKSKGGWNSGNGADAVGFAALPAGGRGGTSAFNGQGTVAVYWSTTSKSRSIGWYRVLHATRNGFYRESEDKMSGFSLRCVKD